jgi:hypothetical protein
MIRAPEIGKIIYRTATIPIITMSGTFDPFKPKDINGDHCFHLSTIQLNCERRKDLDKNQNDHAYPPEDLLP